MPSVYGGHEASKKVVIAMVMTIAMVMEVAMGIVMVMVMAAGSGSAATATPFASFAGKSLRFIFHFDSSTFISNCET